MTARSPLRQVKAAGAGDGAKVWLDPTSCNHAIYMVRAAGCPPRLSSSSSSPSFAAVLPCSTVVFACVCAWLGAASAER